MIRSKTIKARKPQSKLLRPVQGLKNYVHTE